MIFMGNGEHSAAECWNLVAELTSLLIDLGGLQQPIHADGEDRGAWLRECQKRDQKKWDERAECFVIEVAKALGFKASLQREQKPEAIFFDRMPEGSLTERARITADGEVKLYPGRIPPISCASCDFCEPRKYRCRKLESLPMVGEHCEARTAPDWCPLLKPQTTDGMDKCPKCNKLYEVGADHACPPDPGWEAAMSEYGGKRKDGE